MSTTQDMKGKTCLITGATSGIGKATAVELARRGATVVMVGRDQARSEAAVADVKAQGGNQDVHLLLADLSSQASIRKLAADFQARWDRLHVLVNNAGGLFLSRSVTVDGIESTFAVNHLAYFLLTSLLLPVLKASAPARIVNVASDAHRGTSLDFTDLQGEKSFGGWRIYGQSKLANILFTSELARRLAGTGVTANCLHPGVVSSGLGRHNGTFFKYLYAIGSIFMITPEKGARTTVYLATSPQVEGVTGKYFKNSKETQPTKEAQDTETARRLWEVSEQMTAPR